MRTTGAQSRSFTSTAVAAATDAVNARATARKYVTPPPGTKAYARLATSHGDLSLELHADAAPRAVENFLTLAAAGYYDGVAFHRSIKNFMLQGGGEHEREREMR
jgi:peptidyl-prolyl cis-trans isomerase-like protein 2